MSAAKRIILVVLALAVSGAKAAYGLKWTQGDEAAVSSSYLVQENAFQLRMRQPDGVVRHFSRDFEQPNMIYGDYPWVGEDLGNGMFKILTNPEFKGGRTAFVFANGHLRRMMLGRKDFQFDAKPYPASNESLESMWPPELTAEDAKALFTTWKGDDGRLRIVYRNPNKGGCLMAEVALLALALLLLARRWWMKAIGGVAAAAAFFALVLTQSRSAFVAFVMGAAILAAFRARALFTWRRFFIAAGIVCVAAAVLAFSGVGTRFTTGLVNTSDASDALRVKIVKTAPAMMVDAPGGWGLGLSGSAYANWYQAPNEFRAVRTLVNSHLTWLVELGWCGRVAYICGLFAFMFILFGAAKRGASPLPLALFAAFFAAGLFNSVMEAPMLWFIPCASLVFLLAPAARSALTVRRTAIAVAGGFALSCVAVVAIACVGQKTDRVPLKADHGRVVVNGRSAKAWVVDDNAVLGRGFLGRELRMFFAAFPQTPPIGVAWKVEDIPEEARDIVVAGKRCVDFVEAFNRDPSIAGRFESITFISPPFAASSVPEALSSQAGFKVVQGELAVCRTQDAENPPPFLTVVPGAELYIPGWMRLVSTGTVSNDNNNSNN